jgi:hypothetical protein
MLTDSVNETGAAAIVGRLVEVVVGATEVVVGAGVVATSVVGAVAELLEETAAVLDEVLGEAALLDGPEPHADASRPKAAAAAMLGPSGSR